MNREISIGLAAITLAALSVGCESPGNQPLDQGRVISVRPAIPDGARSFVEQQEKLEQERRRRSNTPADQPLGYPYVETPPARPAGKGGSWLDIFRPAKRSKPNPPPAGQVAPILAQPGSYVMPPQQPQAPASQPG